MDKRCQVFVSSTFKDLKEERQAVMRAVLELGQMPAGMEVFPAADEAAWDLIKGGDGPSAGAAWVGIPTIGWPLRSF